MLPNAKAFIQFTAEASLRGFGFFVCARQGALTWRVRAGAFNGRGPWWNAKASHMNAALPGKWFWQQELVFMVEIIQRYQKQASS